MPTEMTITWKGEKVITGSRRETMKTIERTGWFLLDKANETIPEETGDLKSQGKVGFKTSHGEVTAVKISYPGDSVEGKIVALVQHEDTTLHHTGAGRAKWLQLAIQENREEALQMLGADLHAWFGQGVKL